MNSQPLDVWNQLPIDDAEDALLACCGSLQWAATLASRRPYADVQALIDDAAAVWLALPEAAWLEAFAQHPRIGEKKALTSTFLASSAVEQAAAHRTLDEVAVALTRGNRAYEEKFGFLYIVFASGRTASELLGILNHRMTRTREQEVQEAAQQQLQITRLRMNRWLNT